MSEERRLEKLLERIRFLRDKQRFYEGFAAIVFGLYGLGVSLKDPIYRVITFGIAMGQKLLLGLFRVFWFRRGSDG